MYNLFLDDIRSISEVTWVKWPTAEWVTVRSYEEFAACINERGLPHRVSFDHDLDDSHYYVDWERVRRDGQYDQVNASLKEKSGYDCAKFLVNYCIENNLKLPECHVHSLNPVGKEAIKQLLNWFNQR